MIARIEQLSRDTIAELISLQVSATLSKDDLEKFQRCMNSSTQYWAGFADGVMLCIWGLIPSSLLGTEAYLWLHILEPISDYEFVFVRHSQRAVEEVLRRFPTIIGHCEVGSDQSIRWIKWLGATFGEPQGRLVPFVIRAKANG